MSALFAKPSGHGSETPWHQDQGLWKIKLPTAVSCRVALDQATKENGCLQMVPGSHKGGLIPHVKNPDEIHLHLPDGTVNEGQSEFIEMRAGTGVFFPGTTWHYSAPNSSDLRRLGIVCVYVADAEYRQALAEVGDSDKAEDTLWALRDGTVAVAP
jgi:phytanoyl-CoA hydroxylase